MGVEQGVEQAHGGTENEVAAEERENVSAPKAAVEDAGGRDVLGHLRV